MSSFNLGGYVYLLVAWIFSNCPSCKFYIKRGRPQINWTTNILPDLISKEATQFKWPLPPLRPSSPLSPPPGDEINCFLRNWNYVFKSHIPLEFSTASFPRLGHVGCCGKLMLNKSVRPVFSRQNN